MRALLRGPRMKLPRLLLLAKPRIVLTVSDGRLGQLEAIMTNIRERPVCGMSWLILHATVTVLK